jgi:hypothetical protein
MALGVSAEKRSDEQKSHINEYYIRHVAPELKTERERLAALNKMLADQKPSTVPVMKELKGTERRKTRLQYRGNFLDVGDEVKEGVPAVFHSLPAKPQAADRMALAQWLVAPENPLTARVVANRYWEQIFGMGLVRSSEEFGIQGDLPSHPELLDWLATELVRLKWDMKAFVKLLVSSAAYRQSAKTRNSSSVIRQSLSRGPMRLTAGWFDQALRGFFRRSTAPVKPPAALGINAAFGGSID